MDHDLVGIDIFGAMRSLWVPSFFTIIGYGHEELAHPGHTITREARGEVTGGSTGGAIGGTTGGVTGGTTGGITGGVTTGTVAVTRALHVDTPVVFDVEIV